MRVIGRERKPCKAGLPSLDVRRGGSACPRPGRGQRQTQEGPRSASPQARSFTDTAERWPGLLAEVSGEGFSQLARPPQLSQHCGSRAGQRAVTTFRKPSPATELRRRPASWCQSGRYGAGSPMPPGPIGTHEGLGAWGCSVQVKKARPFRPPAGLGSSTGSSTPRFRRTPRDPRRIGRPRPFWPKDRGRGQETPPGEKIEFRLRDFMF